MVITDLLYTNGILIEKKYVKVSSIQNNLSSTTVLDILR